MHPYSFIVSLRAYHPKDDLAFIASLLGLQPFTSWISGDERKTPKGTSIGGFRSNSYLAVRLTEEETSSDVWQLEDFLEQCLLKVSIHADALSVFHNSGGTLAFFVSLYGARNYGFTFCPSLLSRLASANVELQLDIYPSPW